MKFRHLKNTDYRSMPWKNGLGVTTEILIYPAVSSLENFDWRLSTAEITSDAVFSLYPGYDRYLAIIEGKGINLTVDEKISAIELNHIIKFSGSSSVSSNLIDGTVRDINLIYKQTLESVEFKIYCGPQKFLLTEGVYVLVALNGSLTIKYDSSEANLMAASESVTFEIASGEVTSLRTDAITETSYAFIKI